MIRYVPRYLLYVETSSVASTADFCRDDCRQPDRVGHWRFILESLDDLGKLEVADEEPGIWGPRLALLAAVRGLEALEQPSRVTLIARSVYLNDRFARLTAASTEFSAQWELSPWHDRYQNADLWQRVEAALGYHNVECRNWRLDGVHKGRTWHVNTKQRSAAVADSLDHFVRYPQPMQQWQPSGSECLAIA